MKQSDVFSIIFVGGVGVMVSFFACRALMGNPDDASVQFKALAAPLSAKLVEPEPEVFKSTAINPTVEVYVGDCEDKDNNGILDDAELFACERIHELGVDEDEEVEETNEDTESDTEDDAEEE